MPFISTIVVQLHRDKKPFEVALFLGLTLIFLYFISLVPTVRHETGIFGGPAQKTEKSDTPAFRSGLVGGVRLAVASLEGRPEVVDGLSSDTTSPGLEGAANGLELGMLSAEGEARIHGQANGPLMYTVKRGDTIGKIAANFGITVQTIIGANPQVRSKSLVAGEELRILPVSGVLYHVKDGETAESIAASFSLTPARLKDVNKGVNLAVIGSGTTLVIPGAKPGMSASSDNAASALPTLPGYFIMPTTGFNWGKLHPHNAIDIANVCGTPIIAAADGLVADISLDTWNGGYGHTVVIEHPNGTKTRYAHLSIITAVLGDYVKQGDAIGRMGQTGDATGCHLHFEVEGAKNPFAKS